MKSMHVEKWTVPTQWVCLRNGGGVGLLSWNPFGFQSQCLLPLSSFGDQVLKDHCIASSSKSWVRLGNDTALRQSSKTVVLQEVTSPGMPCTKTLRSPCTRPVPAVCSPLSVVQSVVATYRGRKSFSYDTSVMVATSLGVNCSEDVSIWKVGFSSLRPLKLTSSGDRRLTSRFPPQFMSSPCICCY